MNTDELIEGIHDANRRKWTTTEHKSRSLWRVALPAAAAALLLIVLWPRGGEVQAATPTEGIYCNSQCNPDDVLALIDNNINHIRTIKSL